VGSSVSFLGDPTSALTKALDLELTHSGPVGALGAGRCKRFAMIVDDGIIKTLRISETDSDPAGGADPSLSCAEQMIADLDEM